MHYYGKWWENYTFIHIIPEDIQMHCLDDLHHLAG
jgi:hypothetical protein